MRVYVITGHSRPITDLTFNREGDLLFTAAKDRYSCLWLTSDPTKCLGTYEGHKGAVWCQAVSSDSTKYFTGSADFSAIMWDTETGKQIGYVETSSTVRGVALTNDDRQLVLNTEAQMGADSSVAMYDVREPNSWNTPEQKNGTPVWRSECKMFKLSKITCSTLTHSDPHIVTGHNDGEVCLWDIRTGDVAKQVKGHGSLVTNMKMHQREPMFITASKDHFARLFDATNLKVLKNYETERPVNAAAISPLYDHVLLGGGQEAKDVTTTGAGKGKFDSRFFFLIYEEEFIRVKGHFSPINALNFSPDGRMFVTGGEDSNIRLHEFDDSYLKNFASVQ